MSFCVNMYIHALGVGIQSREKSILFCSYFIYAKIDNNPVAWAVQEWRQAGPMSQLLSDLC